MAKAPEGCDDDLEVEGFGTMTRQGSSYVFKTTIGSPPSQVKVGHANCGWTTVDVNP